MDAAPQIQREKARLRAELRARRDLMPGAARNRANRRIEQACLDHPTVAAARTVFVYVSTSAEVATHGLIDALASGGRRVLVPRLRDRETMLAVVFPGWPAMQPAALGILSPPPAEAYPGAVDVVLVPGLAFSRSGARLGYGGGYYDRWLARNPAAARLALAFEMQLVPELPVAPHDALLSTIITEAGVLQCDSPRSE